MRQPAILLALVTLSAAAGLVACSDAAGTGPIVISGDSAAGGDDAALGGAVDAVDTNLPDAGDADLGCGPGMHHSGYPSGGDTDCVPDVPDADAADAGAPDAAPDAPGPDVADAAAVEVAPVDIGSIDVGNLADGATGGLTCTQIGQCVQDECNAKKPFCGLDCGAGATPAVTKSANDLIACVTGLCVNKVCLGKVDAACMNPCVGTFCGGEMGACFADGQNGGNGCSTVFACFAACDKAGQDVFTCESKCYNDLTPTAQKQLADFFACSKTANSTADALNLCAPQVLACAADGKSGADSCLGLTQCVAKCPAADNNCGGACYGTAAVDAQKAYLSLASCFAANASNPGACMPQAEACANPSGTDKCANVLTCIGDCQKVLGTTDDKGYCAMQCMHTMAKPSADAAMAVLQCASSKCPGCLTKDPNCQNCVTGQCIGEVLGCYAN